MDDSKRRLKGSPSRDCFKQRHKDLPSNFYAMDLDFVLIAKTPIPDVICAIDYKQHGDEITFTEVIGYNAMTRRGLPVYIATGDAEAGRFEISRYVGGHHATPTYTLQPICKTESWQDFQSWEQELRNEFILKWNAH